MELLFFEYPRESPRCSPYVRISNHCGGYCYNTAAMSASDCTASGSPKILNRQSTKSRRPENRAQMIL